MTVRPGRVDDAPAVGRVHVRSWQGAYAHVLPPERLADLSIEARAAGWREWLEAARPRSAMVVAERGGDVVGFASVGPTEDADAPDLGEVYAIYVLPEAWGTGVGRELMTAAVEALTAAEFAEAILWVLDDNPRARRFYERGGWRLDGGSKPYTLLGVEVRVVRYRLEPSSHGASARS